MEKCPVCYAILPNAEANICPSCGVPLGMKKWKESRKYLDDVKWEEEVQWLTFVPGKDKRVRAIGGMWPMARHTLYSKTHKPFYKLCPSWNPWKDGFITPFTCDLHLQGEAYSMVMYASFIDMELAKYGEPDPVRGLAINPAMNKQIEDILKKINADDVADPDHGIDLLIQNNPKAKDKRDIWKISFPPDGSGLRPLTEKERSYKQISFHLKAKADSPESLRKTMQRCGYFEPEHLAEVAKKKREKELKNNPVAALAPDEVEPEELTVAQAQIKQKPNVPSSFSVNVPPKMVKPVVPDNDDIPEEFEETSTSGIEAAADYSQEQAAPSFDDVPYFPDDESVSNEVVNNTQVESKQVDVKKPESVPPVNKTETSPNTKPSGVTPENCKYGGIGNFTSKKDCLSCSGYIPCAREFAKKGRK